MQRSWFLRDLLGQLFARPGQMRGKDDRRSIKELCEALLSSEGELSGFQLAATVLERYQYMSDDEKLAFFVYLNTSLEFDAENVVALAKNYAAMASTNLFKELSKAVEPKRQELLRRLNQPVGATEALVSMRADLLRFVKNHPDLARTDFDFAHLLRSWFNRGFLVLKQISWDTPARILDKIIAYEAVHQINDLDDLRRRLFPDDRRCFAFFHPSMPDEPLIFVEVALTADIPETIDSLLSENRTTIDANDAKAAVFYSISNCQKGLAGINFGNLLIKQVVAELALENTGLTSFVTLSPIPGFASWLDTLSGSGLKSAPITAQAAHYLLQVKRDDQKPIDPVARFHLGNGAAIHAIHANADGSENGLRQSHGAMVNYLYDLTQITSNHEKFVTQNTVVASPEVQALSASALSAN